MKKSNNQPINELLDELKSDDIRKRINSVNNLSLIAQALGPTRTRQELIPFLNELMEDEDEVLLALSEALSKNFIELIGGQEYVSALFPPLENLAKAEESQIRDTASKTLKELISIIDIKKNEELLVSMIKRLNENSFYLSKGSASLLIPVIYNKISSSHQTELFQIFQKLYTDPKPSIRKFASINFKDYVLLYPIINEEDIKACFECFLKDDQDFIRIYLVDAAISLTQSDLIKKNSTLFTNVISKLTNDNSWRIKYYLCERIEDLIKGMGKELFQNHLLQSYINYLGDQEPELRSIATSKLGFVAPYIPQDDLINKIIPLTKTLSTDQQNYVRISLSNNVLSLSAILGKKLTTDHILPTFLQLLKDDDSEVRIHLFKKLNEITKVLGLETLSQSVIPALTTLSQDKNWRIRQSSIEIISFFAKEIGKEFLNEKIIQILMSWMSDKVFAVREKSIECIRNLLIYLGSSWNEQNVMPKILAQQNVPNYLHRTTVLYVISAIADKLNEDYLQKTILQVIVQFSKDPVPNVRMNMCKTIKATYKYFKDKETLKKILQTLKEDMDNDVKYQCTLALECF